MKRVLITGASGFIGRQVLQPLRERGFELHCLHSATTDTELRPLATWHNGDLFKPDSVNRLMQEIRPYGLAHFAWNTAHGSYWDSPVNVDWASVSLHLIAEFVRTGGKRCVVAGSCAEYQWGAPLLVENEAPTLPASLYGTCKNSVREVLQAFAPTAGLSWAWARIFFPFGPYEKPQRLVPKVIRALLREDSLKFDAGSSVRDFMDVRDVGDAFAALFSSGIEGPVNVASGKPISIRSLVETLAEHTGNRCQVCFDARGSTDGQPGSLTAATRRLNEEVGWHPRKPLTDRLAETVRWWRIHLNNEERAILKESTGTNE